MGEPLEPAAVPRRAGLQRGEPADDVPAAGPHDARHGRLPGDPDAVRQVHPVPDPELRDARGRDRHRGLLRGAHVLSENVLLDTILSLGIMICFYYGLTAFACVWYFRKELFDSGSELRLQVGLPAARRAGLGVGLRDLGARHASPDLRQRGRDRRRRPGVHPRSRACCSAWSSCSGSGSRSAFFRGETLLKTTPRPWWSD